MNTPMTRLLALAGLALGLTGCIGITCNCDDIGDIQYGTYLSEDVPAELPEDDWIQLSMEASRNEVVIDYVDGEGQIWQVIYDVN